MAEELPERLLLVEARAYQARPVEWLEFQMPLQQGSNLICQTVSLKHAKKLHGATLTSEVHIYDKQLYYSASHTWF
jgi:hypothetical protein